MRYIEREKNYLKPIDLPWSHSLFFLILILGCDLQQLLYKAGTPSRRVGRKIQIQVSEDFFYYILIFANMNPFFCKRSCSDVEVTNGEEDCGPGTREPGSPLVSGGLCQCPRGRYVVVVVVDVVVVDDVFVDDDDVVIPGRS